VCVLVQVTSCVGKSCIEEDRQLPPTDWPKDGSIAFDNVFFDYCDGAPCALNGISCTIESGQKIGVCGRTGAGAQQNTIVDLRHLYANLCGIIIVDLVTRRVCCVCAGKSTLLSVLFSLGPLKSGAVSIGGKDLAGISCHTVRSNLAIVPQSPTLFDGVSTPGSVCLLSISNCLTARKCLLL
jgi:ABC-type multidrug transport system fused ATPase/permease subunit